MLHSLLSLLAFSTLTMAAFGLGRPLWHALRLDEDDPLASAVWSIALGLVAAGLVLVGLGLCGLLYMPLVGVLTTGAAFWGLGQLVQARLRRAAVARDRAGRFEPLVERNVPDEETDGPTEPSPAPWVLHGVLWAAGLAAIGSLVAALAPPTAGDALCYHLELPKQFLIRHEIVFLPYHDNSTFPLLAEIWYLWGLALQGGVCAQLVHWGLGLLFALGSVVLATPILGRPWALVAGALVLLVPGINNQMTAPLNDVALGAAAVLATAAWWRAAVGGEGRRWFLLTGVMAGAALGTKYVALLFVPALAVPWLWIAVRRPERRRALIEGAAVVAVVAASIGGVWYVRAAWYRGNPVYPFFGELTVAASLRETDIDGEEYAGSRQTTPHLAERDDYDEKSSHLAERDDYVKETLPASKSPLGRSPVGLLAAPWQATMQPERFGGRGHQLGILPLAALPGLVFCRRLRGLGVLLAVAACYGVAWFLLRQNVRFLLPVVPLLAVAIVWVWAELGRFAPPARAATAGAFALIVGAMAVVGLHRAAGAWRVVVGLEDAETYLIRHDPAYPAAAMLNHLGRPGTHLLTQDYRAFHFQHPVTRENVLRRETGYDRLIRRPGQFAGALRAAGFTHLLLAEVVSGDAPGYDPTLSRLADAELAGPAADRLWIVSRYEHHAPDGVVRRYRLVEMR